MGNWPSHNPQPGRPGVALGLASTPRPGRLVEPARGLSPNRYSSQGHRNTQAPPPNPIPPPLHHHHHSKVATHAGELTEAQEDIFKTCSLRKEYCCTPPPPNTPPYPPPLSLSLSPIFLKQQITHCSRGTVGQ